MTQDKTSALYEAAAQTICADTPVTVTSLEELKREVYLAHVKSFIDENEVDEFIAQELGLNPDWEWGYNYGCKQAVDAAIDHIAELIRTGRIRLGGGE